MNRQSMRSPSSGSPQGHSGENGDQLTTADKLLNKQNKARKESIIIKDSKQMLANLSSLMINKVNDNHTGKMTTPCNQKSLVGGVRLD